MRFSPPVDCPAKTRSRCILAALTLLCLNSSLLAQTPPPSRGQASAGGAFLGVGVAEIKPDRAKLLKVPADAHVEVTRVEPATPAEEAGMKIGDVVVQFNGQPVESIEQFARMVRDSAPGHRIRLAVIRGGTTQTVTAILGVRKARDAYAEPFPAPNPPQQMPGFENMIPIMPDMGENGQRLPLGVEVESLSEQLAKYFGVQNGVLVRTVRKDTPASRAGFRAGDIVVKVDGTKIEHPGDLLAAVHAPRSSRTLTVKIVRDHHEMTLSPVFEDKVNSGQDGDGNADRN